MQLSRVWAEVLGLLSLLAVLVFAMVAPRGLPEVTVAVPAAGLLVVLGVVTPAGVLEQLRLLGPTVGFLAAILLLAHLADAEGVFRWLGARLGQACRGRPRRLLVPVFGAASVTTAVLSLDATVVLLTPVVLATALGLGARPRPQVYACVHLANSASTLLPVSNLTNLLAFAASGLSFAGFAALMSLPWLVVIAVEYLVLRRFFAADLAAAPRVAAPALLVAGSGPDPAEQPTAALVVLALTLVGFGLAGPVGLAPGWVAVAGAAVLTARSVHRRDGRRLRVAVLVRAASPLFCVFVIALGVIVAGVSAHGLGAALGAILPDSPTLPNLLLVAGVAALLANLVNNLPATLMLLAALGADVRPGLVLAMLLGVNIGPNLSYVGSLATLLWRRVLAGGVAAPTPLQFTRLGVLTVPTCLVAGVGALWLGLTIGPGWLR